MLNIQIKKIFLIKKTLKTLRIHSDYLSLFANVITFLLLKRNKLFFVSNFKRNSLNIKRYIFNNTNRYFSLKSYSLSNNESESESESDGVDIDELDEENFILPPTPPDSISKYGLLYINLKNLKKKTKIDVSVFNACCIISLFANPLDVD